MNKVESNCHNEILVSVICTAYNHERYIRQALDSIIAQKTSFKFEVIVHDDKSSDNTKQIIEEYQNKYPNIIKPIFEKENQYSKGVNVTNISFQYASGKYIAFCECDDYWCNEDKLQRQADFLENNPDYVACSASCFMLRNDICDMEELFHVDQDIDLSIKDIVEWDKHHYQTASLMFRREYTIIPDEYSIPGVGDYPRALYLRFNGKIRYFSENMSVYRVLSMGSWSSRLLNDPEMSMNLLDNTMEMLRSIEDGLSSEIREEIDKKIEILEFQKNLCLDNYPVLKRSYFSQFKKLKFMRRVKIMVKYFLKSIINA